MHTLTWNCAIVSCDYEYLTWWCAFCAGSSDHAFTDTKFHFTRCEVSHTNNQFADKFGRLVGLFDAGEYILRRAAAEAERELDELLCLWDLFRRNHARNSQVDLCEIVDGTLRRERFFCQWLARVVPLR